MLDFEALKGFKDAGYTLNDLLVMAYVAQHGPRPKGVIADAVGCSERKVTDTLAKLKQKNAHDPCRNINQETGTGHVPAPAAQASAYQGPDADLVARLESHGLFTGCAVNLLRAYGRERVERQLVYHQGRAEAGFVYKKTATGYLYRAIVNDLPPFVPAAPGLVEGRQRQQEERQATPTVTPEPTKQAEMTREGALTTIRLGLRSRLPHMQAEARRLADAWGIDVSTFADAR